MTFVQNTTPLEFCRLRKFLKDSGMSSSTFYRKVAAGIFHPRKDDKVIYVNMVEIRQWYADLPTVQDARAGN